MRLPTAGLVVLCLFHILPFVGRPALIGGDEPHYALMAHSMAVDRDLELENNYVAVENGSSAAGSRQAGKRLDRHVAEFGERTVFTHPLGLPLLVAPLLFGLKNLWVYGEWWVTFLPFQVGSPWWSGLVGLLFDSQHGLIPFAPIAVVALLAWALPRGSRGRPFVGASGFAPSSPGSGISSSRLCGSTSVAAPAMVHVF